MRYRKDYQETHDIDWFFCYQGRVYHAASNGGRLPDVIDSKNNRTIQERLENEEGHFGFRYSERFRQFHVEEDLSSFGEYASKGFISLDRMVDEDANIEDFFDREEELRYRVVAYPSDNGRFDNEELLALMPSLGNGDIIIEE